MARHFAELHMPGDPLILPNIWDAGSASAIVKAGARAVATSSWAIAAAHGYDDGEIMPFDFILAIVARVADRVDLPLTVDFESGYAKDTDTLTANTRRLIEAGAIGLNFEDGLAGGGLHGVESQAERIKAVRKAGDGARVPIFINARTDLFLQQGDPAAHRKLLEQAIRRAGVYRLAGANGFFVPGLADSGMIREICQAVSLPVNVMMMEGMPKLADIAALGVARISYGPLPFVKTMQGLVKLAGCLTDRC